MVTLFTPTLPPVSGATLLPFWLASVISTGSVPAGIMKSAAVTYGTTPLRPRTVFVSSCPPPMFTTGMLTL